MAAKRTVPGLRADAGANGDSRKVRSGLFELPAAVWSQVGPVPVRLEAGLDERFGDWNKVRREIEVEASLCPQAQLLTLLHEMTHIALWDSGVTHGLTNTKLEAVCDAVSSYLAGAVIAGYIVLRVP